MYPGQYAQPTPRRVNVQCPMISGYSMARFRSPLLGNTPLPPTSQRGVKAVISNLTNTTVKMSFVPLADKTTPVLAGSGSRYGLYDAAGTSVGDYVYVSGSGQVQVQFSANKTFMEVFADGGGPSEVRIQLESLIQWEAMSFDRLDAKYPTSLVQPRWTPTWPS